MFAAALQAPPVLAVQVAPVAAPRTGQPVSAVAAGAVNSLGAGSLSGSGGVLASPGLNSSLPVPAVSPVLRTSGFETAGRAPGLPVRGIAPAGPRPANPALRAVRDAIDQDPKAGRKKPSLSALGSDARAPDQNAGAGAQKSAAEEFFSQKAGLLEAGDYNPLDYFNESFDPHGAGGPGGKAGKGKTGRGRAGVQGRTAKAPQYPARKIRFGDKVFPSVAFRPDRPVEALLVDMIDSAQDSLELALYEFKSREILKALQRAHQRNPKMKIRVTVDFRNAFPAKREGTNYWPSRSLELQSLLKDGYADVRILRGQWRYGIMHHKIAVADGKLGFFGSYNASRTSEQNHYENANFTDDKSRIAGLTSIAAYLFENGVPFDQARGHEWREELPAPPRAGRTVSFNGVELPEWMATPDPEAEAHVVRAIEAAETSIDMSMFTLTSQRVVRAIGEAKRKRPKLKVRVLVDESQAKEPFMKPFVDWLAYQKIPVKTLAGPNPDGPEWAEKNHNKFMILDGKLVLTGSLNYTLSGFLTNHDNHFTVTDKTDVGAFARFFDDMFKMRRAARVVPPAEEPELPSEDDAINGLRGPPDPLPPAPQWPQMPAAREISFNGETFPSSAVRPQHPVEQLIIKAIEASGKSIELALYEFSMPRVLEALRHARKKHPKMKIRIILDLDHVFPKGESHLGGPRRASPEIQALIEDGFDVRVLRGRRSPGIQHQKVAVFDGRMVQFGSYNWATPAEENHFENVKFEDDAERVAFYKKMWDWMWGYSVRPDEAKDHPWADESPDVGLSDAASPIVYNGESFPRQVFSPGLIEETIVRAIRAAASTIDIAMFSFYSVKIAQELLLAKEKGRHVRIVLDRNQSKLMKLDDWFAYHGFDVKILAGPDPYGDVFREKNHNKFMVVDGKLLELGSYNFTKNAEENSYENANYYIDAIELSFFNAYFQMLFDAGWAPYRPKAPPEGLPETADFFAESRVASRLAAWAGY